jgi:hypothetical protein
VCTFQIIPRNGGDIALRKNKRLDDWLRPGIAAECPQRREIIRAVDDRDEHPDLICCGLLLPPEEVAAEIVENLETALERFRRVANALVRAVLKVSPANRKFVLLRLQIVTLFRYICDC